MKKRILYLCLALLVFFTSGYKVNAASLSISSSSKSVTIGSSVTVTVRADDLAGKFSISSSNSSILSGGNGGIWIENGSESFKFTAKKEGTATITVNAISAASFSSGSAFSGSKSITINVVKPREKSTNNNLKSLEIEGYNLTPEFNKDTLEYSIELPADVTKIKINANKEDGYASLDGTGEKDVIEGENRFEIVVTSETGNSKTYIINANVKDNNPIIVEVNNQKLTVIKRKDSLTKPSEAFTEKSVTISDTEIPAFYNEKNNLTLVGLKTEEGNKELYIYNEEKNTYTKYESLTSTAITIISTKASSIPENYRETTINIDDKNYTVYKSTSNQNYALIYAMNLETGEKNWYRYDEKEQTLQIYDNEEFEKSKEEYEEKLATYRTLILGLGSFSILLLIILLVMILKKKKRIVDFEKDKKTSEKININKNDMEEVVDEKASAKKINDKSNSKQKSKK